MQRRKSPKILVLPFLAPTFCFVLVIVLCLTFTLYEYFRLQSFGWMPTRLPIAIHAERSLMELYPSVYVALENHHPNYPGTTYYLMGWQKKSLQALAETLPVSLAATRGRIYIAAREDTPYGDISKLLVICRASGAKSIKLVVAAPHAKAVAGTK